MTLLVNSRHVRIVYSSDAPRFQTFFKKTEFSHKLMSKLQPVVTR